MKRQFDDSFGIRRGTFCRAFYLPRPPRGEFQTQSVRPAPHADPEGAEDEVTLLLTSVGGEKKVK